MRQYPVFSFCLLLLAGIEGIAQPATKDDGQITVQFLQLNDVYEIAPLEHGTVGGMARVATLRQKLVKENSNTYTLLSGDFISPSAMGTILYEGKAIKGRQMIEAMNSAGIDLVTFGNHEFDVKESELKDRINESKFDWVCANTWNKTTAGNKAFTKIAHSCEEAIPGGKVLFFKDTDGTVVRIGIFGICINSTSAPYVSYEDYADAARRAINDLESRTDFIIAITHLSIDDDKKLAAAFPQIRLILGGHEHRHSYDTVGTTYIAKADANARTAYVHRLHFDRNTRQLSIQSQLTAIDNTIPDDDATLAVVNRWTGIADKSLRDQGFTPDEALANLSEPYDGRESRVRYGSTNLTRLIAKAFSAAEPGSDCSLYNSGSIRVDDQLMGTLTQYDVVRILPFGGMLVMADMKGSLLQRALDTAEKHPGNGCFLQYDRISKSKKGRWQVNGRDIDPTQVYRVASSDYLAAGRQQFLDFFSGQNPDMIRIVPADPANAAQMDLRKAVITYLRNGGH